MGNIIARGLQAAVLGLALLGSAGAKAPNIVFILADDLDAAAAAQMPLVKSLITDRGTTFLHHYVSLSLCCPSRSSTLRGQFSHNTTIFKNDLPDGGFGAFYAKGLEASTAATWLTDAGYRTALIGKYMNGYPEDGPSSSYIPPGWTEWMSPIAGTPYKGFNYTMNHNGTPVSFGNAEADYLTDVISNAAADFIRRSVDQFPDKPFFLFLAPYAPHAPAIPAPRHEHMFKNLKAPRGPSFNEKDVSDKPSWVQAQPMLTSTQIEDMDKLYRKRRQSLLAVDEMLANVLNTLQAKGELDNTYIFFTSDNGFHQGQHRLDSGKMTAFEEDLLIPLSVRGPGVPVGQTINAITANVDYASTFAEIAGASAPAFIDGRSLLPFLKGQTPSSWRAALLLENKDGAAPALRDASSPLEPADPFEHRLGTRGDGPGIDGFLGLRINDGTTYLEYVTGERELYSNIHDAAQLRNGYALASPVSRQRLAAWLASLKNASGAALREAELQAPTR
ncbi:MAG TPA: sulfatase [Ideonella sp.]|uniref:sulfatase family protein n=1 Tax=Ideonella sp. TaxID=1929293 RepID=UPI002E372A30|nr:sulfatase [Ideonella sp.]HEX5687420.1 sulfatase [Ideonella sp.]